MEQIDWRMRFGLENVSINSLKLSPLASGAKCIILIDPFCNSCQANVMQMNLRGKTIDFSKNSREVRQKWFWLSLNCSVILVWKLTLNTVSSDQILTIRVGNDFSVKVYIHFARKPQWPWFTDFKHTQHKRFAPTSRSFSYNTNLSWHKQNAMQIYVDMPNIANV